MAKANEIDYIKQVARIDGIIEDQFRLYLANKPFSDPGCAAYLMDIAQVLSLLPPPPARVLDLGVGSGWTSELIAMRGYEVLGLDISPDMIELASGRSGRAHFAVCDYEVGPVPGGFDAVIFFDSLHHAEDEVSVLQNAFQALNHGGILVTVEPGAGHSMTADSLEVMRKYGTTEKDMPFSHQKKLMQQVGFGTVEQYLRLSQLPIENVATPEGSVKQVRHAVSLGYESATGLTSIVIAKKSSRTGAECDEAKIAETLLSLAVAHDKHLQQLGRLPEN